MIWEWLVPQVLLIVFGGLIVRDAWNDKSPRVPRTPERVWWATSRTAKERLQSYIRVEVPESQRAKTTATMDRFLKAG